MYVFAAGGVYDTRPFNIGGAIENIKALWSAWGKLF